MSLGGVGMSVMVGEIIGYMMASETQENETILRVPSPGL